MPRVYPARTVLAQRIRERRLSLEEFCEQLEVFAREKNEVGTVSTRHVQRLAADRLTSEQLRPATARPLERFFGSSIDELLASPENTPHKEAGSSVQTSELSAQKSDLLAQIDQTRHMMDRAITERSITPAQVDKIETKLIKWSGRTRKLV